MVLIRKQSAWLTKNMQEMQSSNCRQCCVVQMWVVSAILLLTTVVFTANAELNEQSMPRAHFIGDDLQVSCLVIQIMAIGKLPRYIILYLRFI